MRWRRWDSTTIGVAAVVLLFVAFCIFAFVQDAKARAGCEAAGGVIRERINCYWTVDCQVSGQITTCVPHEHCEWRCDLPK